MNRWLLGLPIIVGAALGAQSASAAFEACIAESACDARADSAFARGLSEGTAAGSASGFQQGYDQGFSDGSSEGRVSGIADCQTNPGSCGITLDTLFPDAQYGETEFNDNMVSADPLAADVPFWGQSYSSADEDWFFVVTDRPNNVLTINFTVPDRDPGSDDAGDWRLSVRDAVGNVHAEFTTDFLSGNAGGDDAIAYPVTLGFAGTYYVVVVPETLSYYPYTLMVNLRDSNLESSNFLIGAYDAEREPNDRPEQASRMTSGVTLYGLTSLTFDVPVPVGDSFQWGQSEPDWYRYDSPGNEIVTLSFCEREQCTTGNWYVEVYDETSAFALQQEIDAGTLQQNIQTSPLAAFNTDLDGGTEPSTMRFGIVEPGRYYLRVNHKRKYDAPCIGYGVDVNNNGLVEFGFPLTQYEGTRLADLPPTRGCGCDSGYSCDVQIIDPDDDALVGFCPDGSKLDEDSIQCTVGCRCIAFGLLVEVPENEVTSQYNLTWTGSRFSSDSGSTEAYEDFLDRPAFALVDEAQRAYIAYYARPGDPAGTDYWANRLAADPKGLDALITEFWSSAEAAQRYGGMSDVQILETLYSDLFARSMDPEGRSYWTGRLASGSTSVDQVMLEVIKGATGADAAIIANKLAVARYVTDRVRATGVAWSNDAGRSVLAAVTAQAASIEPAKSLAGQLFGF